MTEQQYEEYCQSYITDIEVALDPLEDENYTNAMVAVQGLIDLIGEYWKQRYLDDTVGS